METASSYQAGLAFTREAEAARAQNALHWNVKASVRRAGDEEADYVYAGVGIMKASLFAPFTDDVFRLAPLFFDAATRGRLYGHMLRGRWLHVGTPQAIGEADDALRATTS